VNFSHIPKFRILGCDMRAPTVVLAGVAMCLARSFVEGLWCSIWGMLFMAVAEGRLWMAELCECGSCWGHNGMVGNMTEVVCGSLMSALFLGRSVDTEGSIMMMPVMVVASVLCG
jgi:hypothetical protein